jgi:hypothetical protein
MEKYEAGDEIRGERVAFVRADDDFKAGEAQTLDSGAARGGKESEFLDRTEASGGTRYSDSYENRREQAQVAEGSGVDLPGTVAFKGSVSEAMSSPAAPNSSEETSPIEVMNGVQWAERDAITRYAGQERGPAKKTSEVDETVVAKALHEALDVRLRGAPADSAPREVAVAEGESPARSRVALDARGGDGKQTSRVEPHREREDIGDHLRKQLENKEKAYAEGPSVEAKADISQKRLDLLTDEEPPVAKLREQTGWDTATTGRNVGGDGIEIRDVEGRVREESTLLGATFGMQKSVLDDSDLDSLSRDYAYIPLYFNGADRGKKGTRWLLKAEPSEAGVEKRPHSGSVTFAGYNAAGTGMPALVRYIKDREKARAEIEEIVAELGGSIHSRRAGTETRGLAFGEAAVDTLLVKLKPEDYDTFLRRLGGEALQKRVTYRGTRVAGPDPARSADEPAGATRARGKEEGVTLAIFLVEIREQEKPDQPPQNGRPSGS